MHACLVGWSLRVVGSSDAAREGGLGFGVWGLGFGFRVQIQGVAVQHLGIYIGLWPATGAICMALGEADVAVSKTAIFVITIIIIIIINIIIIITTTTIIIIIITCHCTSHRTCAAQRDCLGRPLRLRPPIHKRRRYRPCDV